METSEFFTGSQKFWSEIRRRGHAQHLVDTFKGYYEYISVDWDGSKYCGINIEWHYEKGEIHLSMLGYVSKAITRLQNDLPK